jgi:uncharacterized membrane protein YdjX (TVP38/TMEM64 family)
MKRLQSIEEKTSKKDRIKFVILLVVVVLLIAATILLFPYFKALTDESARNALLDSIRSKGIWGVLILLGLQLLQVVVAVIPGEVIEVMAGMLYGTWGGYAVCTVGVLISSMMVFLVVRRLGAPFVQAMISEEKMNKLSFLHNTQKLDTIVFILFFIPGTPKDLLTYFVPLTEMKLSHFLFLSTVARIPSILSSTYAGAALGEGEFIKMIIVFLITGAIGILGIIFNDRIVRFFHQRRAHSKEETKK